MLLELANSHGHVECIQLFHIIAWKEPLACVRSINRSPSVLSR